MLKAVFISCLVFCKSAQGLSFYPGKVQSELINASQEAVCYKDIGCFPTGAPFSYVPMRPFPAPEDPALLKPRLKFVKMPNPLDEPMFYEINLIGELETDHIGYDVKKDFTIIMMGCLDPPHRRNLPRWTHILIEAFSATRSNVNIFVFEQKRRRISFLQNYSNLRTLGFLVSRFIKHLQVRYGLDTENKLWLIGNGCGAHMASFAGRRALIYRITALNPLGFMFENEDPVTRLSPSDAAYVDVHHTNAGNIVTEQAIGLAQAVGHVDFYYNGGIHQPGCFSKNALIESDFKRKFWTLVELYYGPHLNCHQFRASEYFAWALILRDAGFSLWGQNITTKTYLQSLSSDGKIGTRFALSMLRETCNMSACVPVGWDSPKSPGRGIKILTTAANPPYYTTSDETSRDMDTFGAMYIKEFWNKWIFAFFSKWKHEDSSVQLLPPVPKQCYYLKPPLPALREMSFNLGCFNQTSPWMVMRSRPISSPDPPNVQLLTARFFDRSHWQAGYNMTLYPRVPSDTRAVPFNNSVMTFIIIHGFYNTGAEPWIGELKDALLTKTKCNVIVADWGGGALTLDYLQAAGNLRMAARVFSNMIQMFINHRGLNVNQLHIIGHSLGAHVAGLIGKSIPGVFQITALDPAQPWFEAADMSVRLTKNDANFVVGVHSDAAPFLPDLGFGMGEEVGHVDFYINGGMKQWKCIVPATSYPTPKFDSIFDLVKPISQIFVKLTLCPHQFAVDIFTEAVNRTDCIFFGHAITMENLITLAHLDGASAARSVAYFSVLHAQSPNCLVNFRECSPLGLDTYFWPGRGSYIIYTKSTKPFCIYESHFGKKHAMRTLNLLHNYLLDDVNIHYDETSLDLLLFKSINWFPMPTFAYWLGTLSYRRFHIIARCTFAFILFLWVPLFAIMAFSTPLQQFLIFIANHLVDKSPVSSRPFRHWLGKADFIIEVIRKHKAVTGLLPILKFQKEYLFTN